MLLSHTDSRLKLNADSARGAGGVCLLLDWVSVYGGVHRECTCHGYTTGDGQIALLGCFFTAYHSQLKDCELWSCGEACLYCEICCRQPCMPRGNLGMTGRWRCSPMRPFHLNPLTQPGRPLKDIRGMYYVSRQHYYRQMQNLEGG